MYSNKGTCPNIEEYGAFSTIYETNEGVVVKNVNDSYETLIVDKTVDVCGIAGDYCVYETTKNLKESNLFDVRVLLDCTASIDGGTKITNFVNSI
jgi:nicotinamidase-related amidase